MKSSDNLEIDLFKEEKVEESAPKQKIEFIKEPVDLCEEKA